MPIFAFFSDHPSKVETSWPTHGRYLEFPAFTTQPQQDVNAQLQRTTIHPVVDKRAQPYGEYVHANMHRCPVTRLPPKTASFEEVREFLYYVIGYNKGKEYSMDVPVVISFIASWGKNGKGLRKVAGVNSWLEQVPEHWWNVYDEKFDNTLEERMALATHLHKILGKLLRAEGTPETAVTDEKKKAKTSLRMSIREMFCFGRAENRADTPPPAYREKMSLELLDELAY